jgi:hypothetical protein
VDSARACSEDCSEDCLTAVLPGPESELTWAGSLFISPKHRLGFVDLEALKKESELTCQPIPLHLANFVPEWSVSE